MLSPRERQKKLKEKIVEYFTNGSKLVLVVDPKTRSVAVYRSPQKSETLLETMTLDFSIVLPGFTCKVAEIFKKRSR